MTVNSEDFSSLMPKVRPYAKGSLEARGGRWPCHQILLNLEREVLTDGFLPSNRCFYLSATAGSPGPERNWEGWRLPRGCARHIYLRVT